MNRHALGARAASAVTAKLYLAVDQSALKLISDDHQWGGSSLVTQVLVLTARSVRGAFSDYRLVLFGLLQPVVILLLFSQVFAGIGTLPGVTEYDGYINYLLPATLVMIATATAMSSGVALMSEVYTGFVGRLRTMPVNLLSVLIARTLADAIRLTAQLTAAVAVGVLALGFESPGTLGLVGAVVLTVVVGWGLSWLFIAIATWQTKPELMHAASFVVMFPLMFASSAYLPVGAMPGWIQVVSRLNPLTYAIDATRALATGKPVGFSLLAAVGLAAGAALLGGLVSARSIRKVGQSAVSSLAL